MMPEGLGGGIGQGWRAVFATVALGVTAFVIYGLFASGFGRPRPAASVPVVLEAPAPTAMETFAPSAPVPSVSVPSASGAVGPVRGVSSVQATLAVISDDLWLTYLPAGLVRGGGQAIRGPGDWAMFRSSAGYVEGHVEHGAATASWQSFRERIGLLNAHVTTVRGKPAVIGAHPGGGLLIAWLERAGTGAWIRVSDSLGKELLAIAASARAPVGD
ncbi:hypothetical protein [Nonomuraea sp. NPDC002799]